ncbi:MAG: hypothetical protein AOA65_0043 [Candidatus Bathyarchaeota archaeon BA1]|nr:MAG: hypothetical protein AOA65_0043 [Candidatus Bathyarchaeota archaeon BA1]
MVTSFRVDELWREARTYAVRHGITVKQLIEFLLRKELKESRIRRQIYRLLRRNRLVVV